MKIRNLEFKTEFYWKGDRYRQCIRPKMPPKRAYTVTCYKVKDPYHYYDMPSGREVKPVLQYKKPLRN